MGSVRLAGRELWRRKGRFSVLVVAITVLVFFLLFQQGLLSGLVTQFVGAIRSQDAEVLVYGDQARRNLEASVVPDETVTQVEAVDGVADAGPLGVATFTVDAGGDLADAVLFGYELDGPGAPSEVSEGRLPQGPAEAVVSSGAGDGFEVGDVVSVVPDGDAIEIVGAADDLSFNVAPTLFVSYDTFVAARRVQNPDATVVLPSAVAVSVDEGGDPAQVAASISDEVGEVDALTRTQAADEAPGVQAVQQSFTVILLLGYVVVAVVIGFFFAILTAQKTDQLTLLRALGVSTRRLLAVLAFQVALVLAVAVVAGSVLAVQALRSGSSGISVTLAPSELVTVLGLVVVLSFVGAAGAARRIGRVDPVEALEPGALR